MADIVRISKTLSYWLRHRPDDAGLTLDDQGWTPLDGVLAALGERELPSDIDTLLLVVETNDKKRFEVAPDLSRIRARQGHSVAIDLELSPHRPPARLYHGTVERFWPAIQAEGLRKMARHHVHLSGDVETARKVGARRGRAFLIEVDSSGMAADGFSFFVTGNQVWLTEHVPPRFLRAL